MESTLPASSQEEMLSAEACWSLLERIASSTQMKKAGRLRNLLLYVGRRSVKEGCVEIHEKEIGVEVFGRAEAYDTSVDNIVRSNVSDLRKRIDGYFRTEGLNEPVIVEIPRGSYVPVFRLRQLESVLTAEIADRPTAPGTNGAPAPAAVAADSQPGGMAMRLVIVVLAIACVALAIGCISLLVLDRELKQTFYPWRYEPSVASFWSGFVDAPRETDIVLPDTSFRLLQAMTKESFSLQEYLSRNYLNEVNARQSSPEMHAVLAELSSRDLGTQSELNLAQSLLALDPSGKKVRLYHARDYLPDQLKNDNVILIGSQFGNPWDQLFQSRLNFTAKDDFSTGPHSAVIVNRAPQAGEQPVYVPAGEVAYCTIAYLPNPQSDGKVLLIGGAGTGSLGAARDFLMSDSHLSSFKESLHVATLPYFEVLIRVQIVNGTPVNETVMADRVYTNGPR
jgi:hypothetical protein